MSNVDETNRLMVKPISSHGDELEVDCGKPQNWTEMSNHVDGEEFACCQLLVDLEKKSKLISLV